MGCPKDSFLRRGILSSAEGAECIGGQLGTSSRSRCDTRVAACFDVIAAECQSASTRTEEEEDCVMRASSVYKVFDMAALILVMNRPLLFDDCDRRGRRRPHRKSTKLIPVAGFYCRRQHL